MKSFTVTFHHTTNYGATLQAYSLQRYLTSIGVDNEIMEYADNYNLYSKIDFSSVKSLLISIVSNILTFIHKKDVIKTRNYFKNFHKKYMKFSEKIYSSSDDIYDNPPEADVLITGSDQVWNLKTSPKFVRARFLDFGEKNAVRFSYGASVGRLNYSDSEKEKIQKYLSPFAGVSLRERTATDYYNNFSNKNCETVLDPVFLTDKSQWNEISVERKIKDKYILCYFVQGNDRIKEVVSELKKETGYKVVSINYTAISHLKADYNLFDVSPEEFLGLYNNAEIVVTTSFHGAAFGLVYEKPTYALIRNKNETRISDLFSDAGLEQFIIDPCSRVPSYLSFNKDYKKIIESKKESSKQYIKRMLDCAKSK